MNVVGFIMTVLRLHLQNQKYCLSVRLVQLMEQQKSPMAWSWIFCSFADNIQETLGNSNWKPSGLPVVVSDWNGYRNSA